METMKNSFYLFDNSDKFHFRLFDIVFIDALENESNKNDLFGSINVAEELHNFNYE